MRAVDLLLLACFAVAPACRRDEVTHFQVKKAAPGAVAPAGPMAGPMGGGVPGGGMPGGGMEGAPMAGPMAQQAPVADVAAGSALHWSLPAGWTETHPGGMRYATLKPAAQGAEVSVIVLPGDAGGELNNVNRWRGQLGLPAQDQAALTAARQGVPAKAGAVSVYDFASQGKIKSRMIAGLISAAGNVWFFKLTGEDSAAGAAKPDFIRLMESLALENH